MLRHALNEIRKNPGASGLAFYGAARGVHETLFKPAISENPALVAWVACLSVPAAYDSWAVATKHETMSHAFHRAWENPNPIYRFMYAGLVGALAVHLFRGNGTAAP